MKIKWFTAILLVLLGTASIALGLMFFMNEASIKSEGVEIAAVITNIEADNSEDNTKYKVYVQYIVNAKVYTQTLSYWDASMSAGQEINIYYNPNNPNELITNKSNYVLLLFPLLGIIAIVVGILKIIRAVKYRRTKPVSPKNEKYVDAAIEEIIYDASYVKNGKSPYYITCKWKNPENGNIYLFKSGNIWYNPRFIIEDKEITTLSVRLNEGNPKKYSVSLESIEEE